METEFESREKPGFLAHLVSIEELAADFGVSIDAYRKRYTNNPSSGFPKPAFTRPTMFYREDIVSFFAKKKRGK